MFIRICFTLGPLGLESSVFLVEGGGNFQDDQIKVLNGW